MADISTMSEGGTDDAGKKVFYGPVAGKEMTSTYGFYYEDGSRVPVTKLINNTTAADFANAGWDVGAGSGVSPAGQKYSNVIAGKTGLTVLAEDAPTYGDAVYDSKNKIVIVRDSNGTSIYNQKGMLISGRGSVNPVGIAAGSGGNAPQIDINAVGAYGSPDYNRNIANAAKQNLAYAGSALQKQAFGALGTSAAPLIVNGKPYTGAAGGRNYVNGIAADSAGNVSTGTMTEAFDSSSFNFGSTTGTNIKNPYAPGTQQYKDFTERQSAYDLMYQQFNQYGLASLVEPLKGLIITGASPAEFTIKLRETPQYKKRFAANAERIAKGLTAISEAEYLGLEDQYQNIMRNYGLPAEYYTRGDMGTQEGFNKFIANDVSAAELEDRVMTAQSRVMNANPEVLASLKAFYPDITNGDILAYTLDPTKGLTDIKRKVTAAEIGGAATQAGLGLSGTRAAELGAAGITKAQAQQGFQTVAEVAPRGGQLAEIYKQSPYTQTTAEAEVFGLAGSTEAARQRKKLTSLETAAFGGSAGAGAIARDRAGVL